MGRKSQSSITLYGLTQGREILCLSGAGLHSTHKNRGKSTCTLSIPQEFATSSFKSCGITCCSRHFPTTHLHHTLCWNTTCLNPSLELPVDCLLCLGAGDSDGPGAICADLRSCGCAEQQSNCSGLCAALVLATVDWEGQTPYML